MDFETDILNYLEGEMTPSEAADFERRLETDADLAGEYAVYARMFQGMKDGAEMEAERAEIAAAIAAFEAEEEEEEEEEVEEGEANEEKEGNVRRLRPWHWLGAAAATVLLLAVGFLLLRTTYDGAYYRDAYPGDFNGTGAYRDSASANDMDAGRTAYAAQNYEAAISAFRQIRPTSSTHAEAQLYIGSAYLRSGGPAQSVPYFNVLLKNPEYREYARWYLALAFLHLDQPEEARPLLEAMRDDPNQHFMKPEAEKILSQID
ncbi:MAG: tetratricopeptide repeat protein [Bacteroidota bacterium]